jgi:SulP family sulfate permease
LQPDVIAGLTAAGGSNSEGKAYATNAGLPIQVGLYTAFFPMVVSLYVHVTGHYYVLRVLRFT